MIDHSEILWQERKITRALNLFALAMDTRDWKLLDNIMLDDAIGDFGDGHKPDNKQAFVRMFERFLGNCGPTQHVISNVMITLNGTTATSSCYVRDIHQGQKPRDNLLFSSPGMYKDEWLLTQEGWRLSTRTKINFMFVGDISALGID